MASFRAEDASTNGADQPDEDADVFAFPASFGQERLWIAEQLNGGRSAYTMPAALRLRGPLDVDALQRGLQAVVERHEALRTSFSMVDGALLQTVAPPLSVPIDLPIEALSGASPAALAEAAAARIAAALAEPFDLQHGPLIRARLLRLGRDEHILVLTLHHLIADGWSIAILTRELAHCYAAARAGTAAPAATLPPLAIQYADWAIWQREHLTPDRLRRQRAYWQERLGDAPPVLDLPTDYPRPALQTYRGARHPLELPATLRARLLALSQREGVTLFMTLCTALGALLSRWSGQTDLVIGTPIANRTRRETEALIGLFINTLPLRCELHGNPSTRVALGRMRATCLQAYAHQDLPFEQLIELLEPPRDPSRSPIVQVVFAWQNTPAVAPSLPDVAVESLPVESGTAQFELAFHLSESSTGLSGWIEYNTDLFAPATAARLAAHFELLLAGMAADPEQPLARLPLLTAAERDSLLGAWNASAADYPRAALFHQLFEAQAARTPEAVALVFGEQQLRYGELNRRANQLARELRARGVGGDTLVALCVERSLEMIVAMLAIHKAGGAYVPLDPAYPAERLHFMLDDAQPAVILTEHHLVPNLAALLAESQPDATQSPIPNPQSKIVSLDADWPTIARHSDENLPAASLPQQLAYVIYTSGSTGRPKGVMVTQRGLLNLCFGLQAFFDDPAVQQTGLITSISFDISVNQIFPTLLWGRALHIIADPVKYDSRAMLRYLDQHAIHLLDAVPSYLQAVLNEVAPAAPPNALRYLLIGGEKLEPRLLQSVFGQLGPEVAIVNIYGLTEISDINALGVLRAADLGKPIVVGRPLHNNRVFILGADDQLQPIGVSGEVCIAGESVSRGYLHRPALTAEKFVPCPFEDGAVMVRTGDWGRWRADGTIEILGRRDQQVKVRGYRIEIGEIEAALAAQAGVHEVVVVARADAPAGGDPVTRLVGYVVPEAGRALAVADLRRAIEALLPEFMVPSALMLLPALPRTPNGKIDRRALPAPDEPGLNESPYVAPRTPVEATLAEIWAAVLGRERIGIDESFFELGGHSLLSMQVVTRIREAFGVELPLRTLFETPTVASLAARVAQAQASAPPDAAPSISRAPRDQPLPLSFAQERLWFVEQLGADGPVYTLPAALLLRGALHVDALRRSLNLLVQRHEALRTTFALGASGPVQLIAPALDLALPLEELPGDSAPEELAQRIAAELRAPFDLQTGPLLRARLLRRAADEHILLLTLHHLVADGWSIALVVRELTALYAAQIDPAQAQPLPALPIQYADWAVWQRGALAADARDAQLGYWQQQLGAAPALALPLDYPRPALQTFRGSHVPIRIDAATTAALNALSRDQGVSLFMTVLTAFKVLLARWSGQSDILVGTPVANRGRRETEGLIGLLINMLVLRTDLADDPPLRELLARVRETALEAYAHQDVPFEQVVEAVQPTRDLSRNPLFQAALYWQNTPDATPTLPGITIEQLPVESGTAQFELTLNLGESGGEIAGVVEYNADLFAPATVARLVAHLTTLLAAIGRDPGQRVSRLPLLSAAEQAQLRAWNDTALALPEPRPIHEQIAAQAARTPEAVALVHEAAALSYAELHARALALAARLTELGVGPDTRVAICLPRTPDLVVALLATLHAGGGYVPLDPAYPSDRLQFMLHDSTAAVVLTTSALAPTLSPSTAHLVLLDQDPPSPSAARPIQHPTSNIQHPDSLAYIIYTSGSTGRPKGVMITHRNLLNFCAAMDQRIGAEPGVWLALTSVSFDISVLELLWTLARGCKVVLHDERGQTGAVDATTRALASRPIEFSLFYFASAAHADGEIYRLLLEGAQFADQHGFSAVWTPERHFHAFGGLYPNPSVTSAAVAAVTKRVQIRAGSVVLPLHSPIRVAEEWAVVDNLSRGRVGISFASGWHADDFVFAPELFRARKQAMLDGIATVRALWRGETRPFPGGAGNPVPVSILPRPIQPELPIWLTAAGNPETFRIAGEIGANLLTHLLGQSVAELAEKIAVYREAWRAHGHPGDGHVTLMIHTFVGDDPAAVEATVREPFRNYLRSSLDLINNLAQSLQLDTQSEQFSEADMERLLDYAYERYAESSGLFGTPERCLQQVARLKTIGVDELACLIDFGIAADTVLASLPRLEQLRQRSNPAPLAETAEDYSLAAQLQRHQVTHVQCTPSQARILLADAATLPAWQGVRALLLGGEALPADLAAQIRATLPAELHNMYGPTETTIWSATQRVDAVAGSIPIGRPIANTQLHILDAHLQPTPVGIIGELYIGGAGVARGYQGSASVTAEKFIPNPFGDEDVGLGIADFGLETDSDSIQNPKSKIQNGSRLYRTGDLARWRADGTVEFLGRADGQLKLRGYRIEPGEIEAALAEHPAIRQAAVVARADEAADSAAAAQAEQRLVAYFVPQARGLVPLRPVLSAAEQTRLLGGRPLYTLPNGMPIAHLSDLQAAAGYREVMEQAMYLKHGIQLEPGAIVFDAGANIGFFSLWASQHCPEITIYAFEPIPPTFNTLQLNIALYGLPVRAFPVGLAARPETAEFTFYPAMSGLSGRYADLAHDKLATKAIILSDQGYASASQGDPSLSEAELDAFLETQFRSERYTCQLRTLSEVIAEERIARIDLLKIDVERAEVDVLRGLRDEDWAKIKQVTLEVDTQENLREVVALLERQGFAPIVDDFFVIPPDERQSGVFVYMVYASRAPLHAEPASAAPPATLPTAGELRGFLKERLPEYMIPATFVPLAALPLTPNGKLNRRALPAPSADRPTLETSYVAPRNELEQRIAAVWQELLGVERVGMHDTFFELGGSSLLIVQLRTRLRAVLDRDLSLVELFQYPTIDALAQHLSQTSGPQPPARSTMDKVRQQAERQKQARQQKRSTPRSAS